MSEARLFLLQRGSAAVLGLCVAVHLVTLVLAVQAGLSAEAILGRTRGQFGWLVFYGLFAAAAAVHAPIGLRAVLRETAGWKGQGADLALLAFGALLLAAGWRAAWAVFA
ncbi:MAG: succinate dehydrogenase [Alphaproteobacteria bacterium]|nr:succinate dehydrogenase [Alphaproteobacteria bacterium]